MTAIVTTAASAKALIVTRSLGRKGIKVITADHRKYALASLSKYSNSFFLYPSPRTNPEGFIDTLEKYARVNQPEVLIPTHSEDTYIIAKHKARLSRYMKLPVHDYETIMEVNDKGRITEIAEKLGVPVPRTRQPRDLGELDKIAGELQYPVVIKLRGMTSSVGLSYARSAADLISKYSSTVATFKLEPGDYPIVQEYIPGDGYGVSMLYNNGELRAQFTHKRIREYPISGGPSTCRVSVRHPEMEGYARTILEHFRWHGVAMVEFKMDRRTGVPYLLEVNPRIWGSINQAIQSGVDFPHMLYRMAKDGDVDPVLDYREGVVTRNYFTDTISLMGNLVIKRDVHLAAEFFKPCYDDIIQAGDLYPTLGFTYMAVKARLKSEKNK